MSSATTASSSVMAARKRPIKALKARVENQSATPRKGLAESWPASVHKAQASQNMLRQVTNLRTGGA